MNNLQTAHMYIFSDACPTDWLEDCKDDEWHTIVNFVFESDPSLLPLIKTGEKHETVLPRDALYASLISGLSELLPSKKLKKWAGGDSYKLKFCEAFSKVQSEFNLNVSACSFQEKTLKASESALLNSYRQRVCGSDGRGSNFFKYADHKGRLQMKQTFVNFNGLQEICAPKNQMLVMLLTAWFINDQYAFHRKSAKEHAIDNLEVTIVSDRLSGDDDISRKSEQILRNLIDPDGDGESITLTRSSKSDLFSGDLLVDNLAGWLNYSMRGKSSNLAQCAKKLESTGIWKGWHQLVTSETTLKSISAVSELSR